MTHLDGLGLTATLFAAAARFQTTVPGMGVLVADEVVDEVREKAKELEKLLDDFSERLRRMRQRNRQVQDDIASFEEDLDRLRSWLADHA